MQVGDLVRLVEEPAMQQVWCIKDIKSDHRGIWIQIDEEDKDVWHKSNGFEVIDESR